ncbi:multiple PDZ domain protein isoform X2 [Venturia canescens]|uniref:multiple PDZ domain protein isoform X2 n=1 Tax=Venturia canescens TaxID=32260 RepID=UPI001C9D2F8D|nr:multiple PDZ domain protein isoform X2 [Venturia canescens]
MTVTEMSNGTGENKKKHWGPERRVTISREPGLNLGFSIVGGNVDVYNGISGKYENISGIFIKYISPNSPAAKTNKLKAGDRIIEVDGINLGNSTHARAVEMIQIAGDPVHLLVQSLEHSGPENYSTIRNRRRSKTSGHQQLQETHSMQIYDTTNSSTISINQAQLMTNPEIPEVIQKGAMAGNRNDARTNTMQGSRADELVGMEGHAHHLENQQSSARMSIRTKTQILPANDKSHDRAPERVPNKIPALDSVKLKYSSEESSEDEDTRHLEGNVYTKSGMEISRKSAGNVKLSKDEIAGDPEGEDEFGYTSYKIQKKYRGYGGNVIMVELKKNQRGLGISLSGHKDRNKMTVFICGINPNGTAFKTGGFEVADEVIEVNGLVLQGRCHLNASSIIKSIPGNVFKFIVGRKPSNINELAVKPLSLFPSTHDEEDGNQFNQYKGVHTVSIKKGQYGLGIMIIEGKHAEVGQGIFVSDIQEGSAAEQAGLQVGDLILSVNFDCLLGSTYDEATGLLKKAEGVVTLTVCNPNQKKVAQEEEKNKQSELSNCNDGGISAEGNSVKSVPSKEPEKPKEPEPPQDPKDCKIVVGRDTTIEFKKEPDQAIGFTIVGGSNTVLVGIFILDVYADGSAGKDGRLKAGDQIIDFCHQNFKSIEYETAHVAVSKASGLIHMVVFREEKPLEEIEVDFSQKPGKGIGICITAFNSTPGAYISEVPQGLVQGSINVSINQSISLSLD